MSEDSTVNKSVETPQHALATYLICGGGDDGDGEVGGGRRCGRAGPARQPACRRRPHCHRCVWRRRRRRLLRRWWWWWRRCHGWPALSSAPCRCCLPDWTRCRPRRRRPLLHPPPRHLPPRPPRHCPAPHPLSTRTCLRR